MTAVLHYTASSSAMGGDVAYGWLDSNNSSRNSHHFNVTTNYKNNQQLQSSTLLDSIEVDRLLWIYWSPFTFLLGLIGNILVIRIFGFAKSTTAITTTSTTSIYFTVMAIADVSFLIFGIVPEWLEHCNFVKIKETHYIMCKLEKFLFYVSGDVAIWIICVNTMDRFIAVCFPFTQQIFRKAVYAKVSCLLTFFIAVVKNTHVFWTRGPEYDSVTGDLIKNCGRPEPYKYFEYYIRPWIAFVVVAALPFTLLAFFNIFIIRFLIREQRRVRATGKKHQPDFTQTICMCVAVALAFLVFVTPSLILYIGKPYWSQPDKSNYAYNVAKAVTNQLSYVNHSINFLLYCITAKKFREEAIKILVPKKFRQHFYVTKNKNDDCTNWKQTIRRTTFKRETEDKQPNDIICTDVVLKTEDNTTGKSVLLNNACNMKNNSDAVRNNSNITSEKGPLLVKAKVVSIDENKQSSGHGSCDDSVTPEMIAEMEAVEISDNDLSDSSNEKEKLHAPSPNMTNHIQGDHKADSGDNLSNRDT